MFYWSFFLGEASSRSTFGRAIRKNKFAFERMPMTGSKVANESAASGFGFVHKGFAQGLQTAGLVVDQTLRKRSFRVQRGKVSCLKTELFGCLHLAYPRALWDLHGL